MNAGVQNCSRWLKELSCESSVLSPRDWDLVMKIQSMAQKRFNAKTSYVNYGGMSKELSYLVSNLQKLVELQKKYSESARYFQQYYPQWRPIRDENIKILREIADTIQKTKENCEGARILGSLASLIGGGTSLAAEDEDSFAAKFGRGITLLGTAVAAGSTLAEEFVLHMKIEESKDTVEKDRFYFNRMWSSYVDCSETVTSLDQIFKEIDSNRYPWENARKTIESFVSRIGYNPYGVNIEMSIQKLLNSINLPPKFQREISDVVSVITTIVMIWEHHGSLFELASKAFEIKDRFETFTTGLMAALNVWSKFDKSNSRESWKSDVLAGMLMDVVNIVKTCEDSDERSESENIRKIANVLENEAIDLRRMYNHFVQHDMPMYALRQ